MIKGKVYITETDKGKNVGVMLEKCTSVDVLKCVRLRADKLEVGNYTFESNGHDVYFEKI